MKTAAEDLAVQDPSTLGSLRPYELIPSVLLSPAATMQHHTYTAAAAATFTSTTTSTTYTVLQLLLDLF